MQLKQKNLQLQCKKSAPPPHFLISKILQSAPRVIKEGPPFRACFYISSSVGSCMLFYLFLHFTECICQYRLQFVICSDPYSVVEQNTGFPRFSFGGKCKTNEFLSALNNVFIWPRCVKPPKIISCALV
jgi:hypothetical protein